MTPSPQQQRGRARELSPEQVEEMRADLRFLVAEGGWKYRSLNEALGFPAASGMLRNIVYDKSGRASTTRARYDALRRIREEGLAPGVVLVEAAPPKPPKRGSKPAASDKKGRGSSRRGKAATNDDMPFADEESTALDAPVAASFTLTESSFAGDAAPALVFQMNGTDFSARQQSDGQWRVTLSATCSTDQMMTWTRQILSDHLDAAPAPAPPDPAD